MKTKKKTLAVIPHMVVVGTLRDAQDTCLYLNTRAKLFVYAHVMVNNNLELNVYERNGPHGIQRLPLE
jgi:hypothetical protein